MDKNWLIRTRHNQILGPVSKEKVVEFVEKGSLVDDDEITTGNGYWFSIKEKELLDKYLYGDVPQGFNPISEAPNVLTDSSTSDNTSSYTPSTAPKTESNDVTQVLTIETLPGQELKQSSSEEDEALPSESDLEYPDMDASSSEFDDVTQVGSLPNLELVKKPEAPKVKNEAPIEAAAEEDEGEALIPQADDLEYPDMGEETEESEEDIEFKVDITPEEPAVEEVREDEDDFLTSDEELNFAGEDSYTANLYEQASATKAAVPKVKKKKKKVNSHRNDGILFFILSVIIFSILFGVYYYYAKILKKTLTSVEMPNIFISNVYAQPVTPADGIIKKKVL